MSDARAVGRQVLQTVREWETEQSSVATEDIVAAVTSEDVPREAVLDHVERLERAGEIYRVDGGWRVP